MGTRVTARRTDGTLIATGISPYPPLLFEHVAKSNWESAIRLCRFVKDKPLWACLAALAVNGRELNASEVAYAAIDEVDKVQFILHIKEIPTNEGRNAELALFRRQPYEAEAILLQSQLYYRAIKMWIRLFNWDRALELAVRHKTHVDTVLMHRARYLAMYAKTETNKHFLQYVDKIEIDEEKIEAKVAAEKEKERQRPDAREYK